MHLVHRHRTGNEYPVSQELLDMIIKETERLQQLPVNKLRMFSVFKEEFSEAARYYFNTRKDNISEEIEWLFGLDHKVFVHGDMLLKNIGICGNEVFLFDFQNSCCGPADWDKSYLLSEFMPEFGVKYIDETVSRFVLLILKIRIGRAIKRNRDFFDIVQRLEKWERFIGANK